VKKIRLHLAFDQINREILYYHDPEKFKKEGWQQQTAKDIRLTGLF